MSKKSVKHQNITKMIITANSPKLGPKICPGQEHNNSINSFITNI